MIIKINKNKIFTALLLAPLMQSGVAFSNTDISPQIVGGSETQPYSRPYQVALLLNGRQGCGGTLISKDWVLTAAHCLDNATTNSLSVRVGAHSISQNDGQQIPVSQIITHEYWRGANSIRSGYDIAVLRLASPASAEYTPAKLPTVAIEQAYAGVDQYVTVSGWGLTSNQGRSSDRLREVNLPVISNQSCSSELSFNMPTSVICGGGTGGVSACNGDSGGPYAVRANGQYYSIGTVSWGQGCQGATAFTRTSSYVEWIAQKTGISTGNPVDSKPTANFSFDVNNTVVSFTDMSSDDQRVVEYQWSFGDSQTSNVQNPTHTYTPGSYNVTLTVTDNTSQQNTISKVVRVTDSSGDDDSPALGCGGLSTWNTLTSYALGEQVSYQGTKYEAIWWSTGANPTVYSNVWENSGACSDDGDNGDGDNGDGNEPNLSPKAGFNTSVSGLTVSFTNTSTDDYEVVSSSWMFGDSTSSNSTNPTHTFSSDGEYTVTLTVIDAGGLTSQVSERVRVEDENTGRCNGIDTWNASTVYLQGAQATLNNQIYTANWWVQGENPRDSGQWGPWALSGQCN